MQYLIRYPPPPLAIRKKNQLNKNRDPKDVDHMISMEIHLFSTEGAVTNICLLVCFTHDNLLRDVEFSVC